MKVYITKYALTSGIIETNNAVECGAYFTGMIKTGPHEYFHGEGREWHRSREAAVERAEEMRLKKIESLRKRIAKLEKLAFE